MGLIVKATETAPLRVKGINIPVESCYIRLGGFMPTNGKELELSFDTYHTKDNYSQGEPIIVLFQMKIVEKTMVPVGEVPGPVKEVKVEKTVTGILPNIKSTLKEGESQSIETAHLWGKQMLEDLGYEVTIDLN